MRRAKHVTEAVLCCVILLVIQRSSESRFPIYVIKSHTIELKFFIFDTGQAITHQTHTHHSRPCPFRKQQGTHISSVCSLCFETWWTCTSIWNVLNILLLNNGMNRVNVFSLLFEYYIHYVASAWTGHRSEYALAISDYGCPNGIKVQYVFAIVVHKCLHQ